MKIRHFILISISGVLLSSCAGVVPKGPIALMSVVTPPDIIVTINAGAAEITSTGSPDCNPQNKGNGCVHIKKGSTGLITFKLAAPPFWAFTSFEICKGNTNANKDCNLNVWERMEFVVTGNAGVTALVPDSSGVVDLTSLSSGLDSFILFDQNRIAQVYYYRVQVCNSNTTVCSWADPPMENEGTN